MKKQTLKPAIMLSLALTCLAMCSILISGCHKHNKCIKCSEAYAKQSQVTQIQHLMGNSLKEKFNFFYKKNLIDSLVEINYGTGDSIVTRMKVYYSAGSCMPTSYVAKAYVTGIPVSVEKAFMTANGDHIINKHLAFYPDDNFLVVNKTADIDYMYNLTGQVMTRNGTDYHVLIYPNVYSNENAYNYTGNNITKIVAQKEQAGYNLSNVFDSNHNPFNIQDGALYYLLLTSYPDEEYFETICRDRNNPTVMVYKGTDTSNSFVTITFTFTYVYNSDNYPTEVGIHEMKEDEVHGNTETDHGIYRFSYN